MHSSFYLFFSLCRRFQQWYWNWCLMGRNNHCKLKQICQIELLWQPEWSCLIFSVTWHDVWINILLCVLYVLAFNQIYIVLCTVVFAVFVASAFFFASTLLLEQNNWALCVGRWTYSIKPSKMLVKKLFEQSLEFIDNSIMRRSFYLHYTHSYV